MSFGRVAIAGLGLIGGSIAKALRERGLDLALYGIDHASVLSEARGLLDAGAVPGSDEALELLSQADLIVLAAPSRTILESLPSILDAAGPDAAVTDTASVKLSLHQRALAHPRGSRFVPGHPMAGREIGGFEASRADLFERKSWFLVESSADVAAVERVRGFVEALGAVPCAVSAEEHDFAMGLVSHLPHLVASALVELAAQADVLDYAGPGFKDTTRIAGGPDAIWADIFAQNRANLVASIDALVRRLDGIKVALASGEREGVEAALALLAMARRAKASSGSDG